MFKQIIASLKKKAVLWFVLTISLYALYLRLLHLSHHELWVDELCQLSIMRGSFFDLLRVIPATEYCSYLSGDFYLIYPFFKIFSYNKWGLAIPHIISTILGFFFLYLISKRYLKTIWGYVITFSVVCFNATLLQHATEIRTYAILPTLALATFYFSQELFDLNFNMSFKKQLAIGSFFILVIWFHFYGIMMLFYSVAFLLLFKIREKSFKIIVKDMIKFFSVVLCIAMPLWLISVFGQHQKRSWEHLNINPFIYIPNPLTEPIGFLKGIFGNLVGYKKFYFLLIGMLFPFVFRYDGRLKQIAFLIITVFIPIGIIYLSSLITWYYFVQRAFIWVMPFFALYLGWTWDSFILFIIQENNFLPPKDNT